MTDPRTDALEGLTRLVSRASRGPLAADECLRAVELVGLVPGWATRVAHVLSSQRDPAAVDALRQMSPQIPGVVEGLYQAFTHGVTRHRRDGSPSAAMLAIDFRGSRARFFDDALARAAAAFGDALEVLRVDDRIHYRFGLFEGRGTLAGRASAAAHDIQWLHAHLGRLRGTRLWINGWCFDADGPLRTPVQVHLVRGWLSWAASRTQTGWT
jgi:hypothetical protein